MAYKKNEQKLKLALEKVKQIKQQQPKQDENSNGHSKQPGF